MSNEVRDPPPYRPSDSSYWVMGDEDIPQKVGGDGLSIQAWKKHDTHVLSWCTSDRHAVLTIWCVQSEKWVGGALVKPEFCTLSCLAYAADQHLLNAQSFPDHHDPDLIDRDAEERRQGGGHLCERRGGRQQHIERWRWQPRQCQLRLGRGRRPDGRQSDRPDQ